MQLSDTYGASEKLAMENGRLRNIQIKVKKVICSLNCNKKKKEAIYGENEKYAIENMIYSRLGNIRMKVKIMYRKR